MAGCTKAQLAALERYVAWPRGLGHVFDLTTSEFIEFLESMVGTATVQKYLPFGSGSMRATLKGICAAASNADVVRILYGFIDYGKSMPSRNDAAYPSNLEIEIAHVAQALEAIDGSHTSGALVHSSIHRPFSTLVFSITNNLKNNRPDAAIDHLHTYSIGRLTEILALLDIPCSRTEPLHSRYGKLKKALEADGFITERMSKPMSAATAAFEGLNSARNHNSLAHDNPLLAPHEARYLVEITMAALRIIETFMEGSTCQDTL